MYRILYNDNVIFDPYGENEVVTDAKLSSEINAASYLDFTMSPEHPLYNTVAERDGIVYLYYNSEELFQGVIDSIETDFDGYKSISCISALDYLNDTVVRPYSTVVGEEDLTAPSEIDAYFSWLIQQHNSHVLDSYKQFEIGINEASKFNATNSIYVKNSNSSPTATEITNNLLDPFGGYLTLRYENNNLVLDLYSDVHDMNTQIIDFGVNLLDFTRTIDTNDQYTAIRPVGGTPEGESDSKPVTIESLIDGPTSYNSDVTKQGDVIYSVSAVKRYGYKETEWRTDDASKPEDLLSLAVPQLIKMAYPIISIDIKAVDLSLYMEGYKHLSVGQAVRIRSVPHGVDEYMMVSSINLDLQDPGQSEYVLGASYDTLTGQQSTYLKNLNNNINSSLDAVASLTESDKQQSVAIGHAQQTADDAHKVAEDAQQSANNAQQSADDAKDEADRLNEALETIRSEVDTVRQDSLETSNKADELSKDLDSTKAEVKQVVTEFGEVKTSVDNAVEKADQSLQVSTQASQTATEAQTTATSAYKDAQTSLTQSSQAVQTAKQVQIDLSTNYQTTGEADAKYATQSSLTATSEQIKTEVSQTYATKDSFKELENIANSAIQTWMGPGVPTLEGKPASDWNTDDLKKQHSGDIYYDMETGYSYRFGSSDGSDYQWSLIKDSDITKAIADAANAQEIANGVQTDVSELKIDIPATYATKTELTQTADSISSTVAEVANTADNAITRVTTVEQTADSLTVKVGDAVSAANTASANASTAINRVGSLETCIKMTSSGVRVGKISNGSFTGYSALVNSSGSFDILNANSNKVVTFGPKATKFYNSSGTAKLGMLYDADNNLYQVGTLASNSATKINSGLTVDGSMLNLTSSDRNVKIQAANGRIELHPSPNASNEDNGVCFYSGIRFEHDGVAVRHFRRGSTVLNPNGASGASITTAIRHVNGDVFIAINGDWQANRLVIMGTDYDNPYYNVRFYNPGSGNFHSSIRIDWLLIETENV